MHYGYLIYMVATIILSGGLYIMISSNNYIKKIIGLTIFQNGILIFYISLGKISNGIVPIDQKLDMVKYTSPIPHVLMLTAIVVGFATLSVSLGIARMIKKEFDSLDISVIKKSEKYHNKVL